jgi:hypothetical protein
MTSSQRATAPASIVCQQSERNYADAPFRRRRHTSREGATSGRGLATIQPETVKSNDQPCRNWPIMITDIGRRALETLH